MSVPSILAEYPYVHWEEVHFRDLDALGHVNNVVYAGWLESARISYYMDLMQATLADLDFILAEMTISYKAPAYFGERLAVGVRVSSFGTKSFVMEHLIAREGDEAVIATARTVLVFFDYKLGKTTPVPEEFRRRASGVME